MVALLILIQMALSIRINDKPFDYKGTGRAGLDIEDLVLKIYYNAPKALSNESLAEYLGIATSTLYDLKNKSLEFSEALKHYKRVAPIEVLNSFKKLAVGYSYDETEKKLRKSKVTGRYELQVVKVTTKHITPNPTAGIFYLKNQMPEEFKDKTETVVTPGADMELMTFSLKRRE